MLTPGVLIGGSTRSRRRSGQAGGSADERVTRRVTLTGFEMMRTEVTNRQYQECVSEGPCRRIDELGCMIFAGTDWYRGKTLQPAFREDAVPVVCASWSQAKTFCGWVGGRLPTEAEWEYAARSGGKAREYPWGGEAPSCGRVVMGQGGPGCGRRAPWPVCSRPEGHTEQGLCDMAGNVWEWAEDEYQKRYSPEPARDPVLRVEPGRAKVARGGSFTYYRDSLRTTDRFKRGPDNPRYNVGFRCVRGGARH